jgi:hypothetical protein
MHTSIETPFPVWRDGSVLHTAYNKNQMESIGPHQLQGETKKYTFNTATRVIKIIKQPRGNFAKI